MSSMHYSLLSKIRFYFTLAYYNLLSPLECRNYRLKVFINEFYFLILAITHTTLKSEYRSKILLKTVLGDYFIRNMCSDIKIASPSYERMDINRLISQISLALDRNHKVIFADIGAQFGKYTVSVGNHFKRQSDRVSILSFEPDPGNFELLKANVRINKIKNVRMLQIALSDKNKSQYFYYYSPQKMIVSFPTNKKIRIRTTTLNRYITGKVNKNNIEIFIKLDVEGHETEVLDGGLKFINESHRAVLLVEDSFEAKTNSLVQYLEKHWKFVTKITAYNSFWVFNKK